MGTGSRLAAAEAFRRSVEAIEQGRLIHRESTTDKEFHFQNWFGDRLRELDLPFEAGGRNSYPDYRMVQSTDGFEVKGLAYPGRDATFDSNSQMPSGFHNARTIYYVFGRYPARPDGDSYPVLDLVICHGDFLNAAHDYQHKNKNVKAFGSYGDIMIRDRKMYVVPTPFRLIEGAAHHQTLVLPDAHHPGAGFLELGPFVRREAREIVIGYTFDLRSNALTPEKVPNPRAGQEHRFRAWRLRGSSDDPVSLRRFDSSEIELEAADDFIDE
ncbi:MAG: hypothetical protein M0T72_05230 [Candidatus Dormibacteraeota bacterium]|nr:hypothetical protein [Candidatus Dormibacteraeota bacterium]